MPGSVVPTREGLLALVKERTEEIDRLMDDLKGRDEEACSALYHAADGLGIAVSLLETAISCDRDFDEQLP